MAVVIRLARHGTKKKPFYRVVAAHKEFARDKRYLEVLGTYNPKAPEAKGSFNEERINHWIAKGARPSGAVTQIMKRSLKEDKKSA